MRIGTFCGINTNHLSRERATLSIIKMTSEVSVHPGINFLIKHVGAIYQHLFQVAVRDTKLWDTKMLRLLEICPGLESRLAVQFDDMLWDLMQNAARQTYLSMKPWYSCLNPNLPNFHPQEDEDESSDLFESRDGSYVKTPSKREVNQQ